MESVPWQSPLAPVDHLLILLASAVSFIYLALPRRPDSARSDRRSLVFMFGGAALTAVSVPFVWILGQQEYFWTGKEGVVEAVSEGLLAALFVLALLRKSPWIALPALALLLEEVNYGQYFIIREGIDGQFATPRWIRDASGYENMTYNLHNLPIFGTLWRAVPAIGLIVLSMRPLPGVLAFTERWFRKLRVPDFHPLSRYAVLFYIVLTPVAGLIIGGIRLDESAELGAVALVGAAWWSAVRTSP